MPFSYDQEDPTIAQPFPYCMRRLLCNLIRVAYFDAIARPSAGSRPALHEQTKAARETALHYLRGRDFEITVDLIEKLGGDPTHIDPFEIRAQVEIHNRRRPT